MTKVIVNERANALKTGVNLFFTITRPQNGQMLGINDGKRCCSLAIKEISEALFTRTQFLVTTLVSIRLHLSFTGRQFEFVIRNGSFLKHF